MMAFWATKNKTLSKGLINKKTYVCVYVCVNKIYDIENFT